MPSFESSHANDVTVKHNAADAAASKSLLDAAVNSTDKNTFPISSLKSEKSFIEQAVDALANDTISIEALLANKRDHSHHSEHPKHLDISNPYDVGRSHSYKPENDPLLQQLAKSGQTKLRDDLVNAYGAVQSGDLTMDAYSKFEGGVTNLSNNPSTMGYKQLAGYTVEQGTLEDIRRGISIPDQDSLQKVIDHSLTDLLHNGKGSDAYAHFDTNHVEYDPQKDQSLQKLGKTGDYQLKNTLLEAHKAVLSGDLSWSAFAQFEGLALNYKNNPSQLGVKSMTNSEVEGMSMVKMLDGLEDRDRRTLSILIREDIDKHRKPEK